VVLDTSAVLALLLSEPEAPAMVRALARDGSRLIGAPTLVEATAVVQARKGHGGVVALDSLLARLDVRVVPMSVPAAKLARLAYARFGKGVGDPGMLNFGDCLAYGVAMSEGEPLLFKGDDFSRTDVLAVAYGG
jgi:ribonuclease VapC